MLVIGTSLRVAPVSEILPQLPPTTPVVLINRELVGQPHSFDVELLGDSDIVVDNLCRMLDDENSESENETFVEESEKKIGLGAVECSDRSQATEIVNSGRIVRWSLRPSTFLFRGSVIPPDESGGFSSNSGGEEHDGDVDEYADVGDEDGGVGADDDPVEEEHGAHGRARWNERGESGSPASPGPRSLTSCRHEPVDPSGPDDYALSAGDWNGRHDSDPSPLREKPATWSMASVDNEQSPDIDVGSSVRKLVSVEPVNTAAKSQNSGYNEEWGIQRPRPGISIMSSIQRK